jgi:RNA recognition motif-containing protein
MGKKLYVGNLPFDVTAKELEDFFAQTVACETASVITDRFTGQSRGFGFVEMRSDEDAQRAVEQLNGQELKGRALKINEAREQTGGGRGGFGGGVAVLVARAATAGGGCGALTRRWWWWRRISVRNAARSVTSGGRRRAAR